jgi:hypothetical protein
MDVLSTIVFDVMDRALRYFAKLVQSGWQTGLVRAEGCGRCRFWWQEFGLFLEPRGVHSFHAKQMTNQECSSPWYLLIRQFVG